MKSGNINSDRTTFDTAGLAQSKQRCASRCAISASESLVNFFFQFTRTVLRFEFRHLANASMARRSLGFMLLLSSLRQAASRLLSSSSATAMHSQSAESQGSFFSLFHCIRRGSYTLALQAIRDAFSLPRRLPLLRA